MRIEQVKNLIMNKSRHENRLKAILTKPRAVTTRAAAVGPYRMTGGSFTIG